jgi:tRNA A-37 threonylcarbamoyl transferase component Bud32
MGPCLAREHSLATGRDPETDLAAQVPIGAWATPWSASASEDQPTRTDAAPARIVFGMTLAEAVALARSLPARVVALDVEGQRFWLKQLREKRLLLRLQKGSARTLMRKEQELAAGFAARGQPGPEIVLQERDFFVTRDAGPTLAQLLADPGAPQAERARAAAAAAEALARLHAAGLCHGRPHPRDICWNGERITFIDLERGASLKATAYRRKRDLLTLIFGIYTTSPRQSPEAEAASAA